MQHYIISYFYRPITLFRGSLAVFGILTVTSVPLPGMDEISGTAFICILSLSRTLRMPICFSSSVSGLSMEPIFILR